MKLVFVDDSEIWRAEMIEIAEEQGVEVVAYALPRHVDFEELRCADAVVTDNKFGGDGYLGVEFIESIRAIGYNGHIVLYTNYPRASDERAVQNLGGIVIEKSTFPYALLADIAKLKKPTSTSRL